MKKRSDIVAQCLSGVVLCFLFLTVRVYVMDWTGQHHPNVYDLYLYNIEGTIFHGQPSFAVGRWFTAWPWFGDVCGYAYSGLMVVDMAVILVFLLSARKMPFNPILAFAVAGIAGVVLYQLVPAIGPQQYFKSAFPMHQPEGFAPWKLVMVEPALVRNAFPSLHTVYVLLILWAVRLYPWWVRVIAGVFAVLVMLACLGQGQDWGIDLLAALPLTWAVVWVVKKRRPTE